MFVGCDRKQAPRDNHGCSVEMTLLTNRVTDFVRSVITCRTFHLEIVNDKTVDERNNSLKHCWQCVNGCME